MLYRVGVVMAALMGVAELCACQAPAAAGGTRGSRAANPDATATAEEPPPPPPVPDADPLVAGVNQDISDTAGTGGETGDDPLSGGDGDQDPPETDVPPTPEVAESCEVAGCPSGLACDPAGFCVTPPPACTDDSACDATERCGLTGACLAPGACKVNGDCGDAESCRAGVCTVGTDCGQTELTIEPVPPNILVLLDVSGSMDDSLTWGGPSKMQIARGALNQMTATYGDQVRWGLGMFPGNGSCGGPVNVLVPGPGNQGELNSRTAATNPKGSTPINASLASIQASNYLSDPDHPNYLLFVSDGGETCGGSNSDSTTRIQALAGNGINTFVVGFGSGVDGNVLENFANAGGVPNQAPNSPAYYQADSATQLQDSLGTILNSVVGCDFALTTTPQDASKVWAFLDDVMVDRDAADGWALDETNNKVTFLGSACEQLRSGAATDVDVVFGCAEPILE